MAQPIEPPRAPSLAHWERAMRDGNQARRAGHAGVALRHTREALATARALLDARLFMHEQGAHPAVAQALHEHANLTSPCGMPRH